MTPNRKAEANARYIIKSKTDPGWQNAVLSSFWAVSEKNVSVFCANADFQKIIWPDVDRKGR